MNLFGDIDLTKLFDPDSEYGKSYVFGELTDEMIARAEQTLGYKMPASYIELLKVQNGGMISDEFDESWLTTIYGIGPLLTHTTVWKRGLKTGRMNGSILTLVFLSVKHSQQVMICITWISDLLTKTANLALSE